MVVILMGVCGCGKSVVGRALAERFQWAFADADDFHPPANVAKMASGQPLTDDDRRPWLAAMSGAVRQWKIEHQNAVLACSALTKAYRDTLGVGEPDVVLVYLKGDIELIRTRMESRTDHFMPATLLESQFKTLEEPRNAINVSIDREVDAIVDEIVQRLKQL